MCYQLHFLFIATFLLLLNCAHDQFGGGGGGCGGEGSGFHADSM